MENISKVILSSTGTCDSIKLNPYGAKNRGLLDDDEIGCYFLVMKNGNVHYFTGNVDSNACKVLIVGNFECNAVQKKAIYHILKVIVSNSDICIEDITEDSVNNGNTNLHVNVANLIFKDSPSIKEDR